MFEVNDAAFDLLQEEEVVIIDKGTNTIPTIYTVKDYDGYSYQISEDDLRKL